MCAAIAISPKLELWNQENTGKEGLMTTASRICLITAVASLLGGMSLCPADTVAAETNHDGTTTRRPNVILVITDDQGYGEMCCHGNENNRTPKKDQL